VTGAKTSAQGRLHGVTIPFDQLIPRPFSSTGVDRYAPTASGIYGISNAREWIYIGSTDNIRSALTAHLQDRGILMACKPTGFVFEICEPSRGALRQDRLVSEYDPRCNRHPHSRRAAASDQILQP